MPRQVRVEYEGAIVQDDDDRRPFQRTLGEAAEKTGFRVHAYVLMGNHYHLLLDIFAGQGKARFGGLFVAAERMVVWFAGIPGEMLKLLEKGGKKIKKANGYHGSQLNDHGERRALAILGAGLNA